MKREELVADVKPDRSPDRAECDILGMILDFMADSGNLYGHGATLRCRNPLSSPNNFT